MKIIYSLLTFSTLILCAGLNAQIISQFTWNSDPVTSADIGPDAVSVSGSAYSSPGGVGGTNGLNPRLAGQPKRDIDLDIPASPTFDVPGIDISIDFQRNESRGDFVNRGNDMVLGMNGGNLYVNFRLEDGMGGYTTVNSGNVYGIPNDNTFRTYRFFYNPATGDAELRVNGATVWNYAGAPGVNMYWSAPNLRIGDLMDGSGTNAAIFDNLIIAQVIDSPLPVELVEFSCHPHLDHVYLTWKTASEIYNDYFEVQRSDDGINFEAIGKVKGAGHSSMELKYDFKDHSPLNGISYYRLKQVDFDGDYEYSDIKSVSYEGGQQDPIIYPNPAVDIINVRSSSDFKVLNSLGQEVECASRNRVSENQMIIDVSGLPKGVYFIRTPQSTHKFLIH